MSANAGPAMPSVNAPALRAAARRAMVRVRVLRFMWMLLGRCRCAACCQGESALRPTLQKPENWIADAVAGAAQVADQWQDGVALVAFVVRRDLGVAASSLA